MSLRKSWIVLLFFLTCAVPLLSAKQLTADQEVYHHDTANDTLLSEDLAQQLRRRFPKNGFTRWLLNCLLIRTQALQTELTTASYLPYEGKTIGLIRLDKQGVFRTEAFGWKHLAGIVFTTTKDWVILDQLSFVSGDSIVPQQFIDSQERLRNLAHIKDAQITVQEHRSSRDAIDVHITTKDRFPIRLSLDIDKPSLLINHNNLFGWGHVWENRFLYDQGLGYSITYRVPNIHNSGLTGELQYLNAPKKGVKRVCVFRNFTDQTAYAGNVEISKTRQIKRRILDGNTSPQPTSFSFYRQRVWLGTAINIGPSDDRHQGRFFLTGKVAHQHFAKRPEVTKNTNRYFHHYVFGTGSLGFSNKKNYEDQLVYGVGSVENIPYGSKVNLIGGYQFGEFVNRPYLRLDIARGGRIQQLGHLYGAVNVGGFFHEKSVEQGILQLQLAYFTPILGIGNQWIRQFIKLTYLGGHNMFTGELISTNASKAPACLRDPFLGGTQRLHLGLETVLLTPMHFAGCRLAALGFVEGVRLEDAQGKVLQSCFCKALGMGFRCAHPRFSFGTLQVKVGYAPITQNTTLTIDLGIANSSDNLDIDEAGVIPFREY
ncbi:MAG: hypothetical protein RL012_482 [Bacteroidota bacterium]